MPCEYMSVQNKMGHHQQCVFWSCTQLTVLEQSSMCLVYIVVSPHVTVDK